MPNDVQAAISNAPKPEALYEKLEDRILDARPEGRERRLLRSGAAAAADARDRRRGGAHPRALHARAVSRADRRRLRQFRQQRPLPVVGPRRHPADPNGARGLRRAAAGADDLVHPDRARHLEPEDPEGAGALRPRPGLVAAAGTAADAGGRVARPAARASRRPAAGAARPLDDPGASRQRAGSLPRVSRADGEPGRAQAGTGAARATPG